MDKTAWFITHDDYIDRRIFFFTDVLEKQGYKVKLFPAAYMNVLSASDEEYIKRPVTKRIVREYNLLPHALSDQEIKVIEMIKKDEWHLKRTGSFSKKICHFLKQIEMDGKVKAAALDGQYCITIQREGETVCYNSLTDTISRIVRSDYAEWIQKCEDIVIQILNDENVEMDEIITKQDIVFMRHLNAAGERCLYAAIHAACLMYVYNEERESLTEITSYPYDWGKDVVLGREYDFSDYKKTIYNYAPMMRRVKEELETEKPDVIYVADLPTLPIGVMLKEAVGGKLIADCHEWWYKQTMLWEGENEEKVKLVDQFEAILYPKCDLRITVGENLAKRMQQYYHCPFEIIYSCMSQKLSIHQSIDKSFLAEKYGIPKESRIAIFQGGMSTFRNLENLARATRYLEDDSYLLLLTTGDYQEEFKKILDAEGKRERVIWGGWIRQEELLDYTQSVDIGVIPYTAVNDYSECFVPNKLMEYFEVQLPIFYDSSMQELDLVAGGNKVGYGANLKDAKELGTKLNWLLHHQETIDELKNNYINCSEKFRYQSQSKCFVDMLARYKIIEGRQDI